MKVEINIKQDQIVEAALRRFSHFGITKTTLTEVADDLTLSKQVLSYYFHDKQSLVQAVVEKLAGDYNSQLKNEMDGSTSTEEALLKLTDVKGIFFEKYYMLFSQAEHLEMMKTESHNNWIRESGLLTTLFEAGVKSGELKPMETRKTAELLLETLYAFSKCVEAKGGLPDAEVFHGVLAKQREVIKLFYQGLKAGTWQN